MMTGQNDSGGTHRVRTVPAVLTRIAGIYATLPHPVSAIADASAASVAAQKRVERASKGQWFEPGVVRFVLHVAVRHGAGARRTGAERPRMHLLRD